MGVEVPHISATYSLENPRQTKNISLSKEAVMMLSNLLLIIRNKVRKYTQWYLSVEL